MSQLLYYQLAGTEKLMETFVDYAIVIGKKKSGNGTIYIYSIENKLHCLKQKYTSQFFYTICHFS